MNQGDEPAFPCDWKDFQPETGIQVSRQQYFGLTIRAHFASMAMQGFLTGNKWGLTKFEKEVVATSAVELADQLIKELSK